MWIADDGHVDPHITTHAVADAARALGVQFRLRTRVTGIELGPRHEVRAVLTDDDRIEAEHVVNAAGVWAPRVAEMVGARLPSVPVDHQHVLMQAVPGAEVPRGSPCFRDTDNLVYGKDEAGRHAHRRLRGQPGGALGATVSPGGTGPARCSPTWSASRRCSRGRSGAFPSWSARA